MNTNYNYPFFIIQIPTVTELIHRAQHGCHVAGLGNGSTAHIITEFYHLYIVGVNQYYDDTGMALLARLVRKNAMCYNQIRNAGISAVSCMTSI